ncbi:MAG: hypothetical protein EOP61_04370 [Sphingomonadales bacterium]|nr:MAG: hypothetical protein EOP61_04370 [Sphingomonadales bacterium]
MMKSVLLSSAMLASAGWSSAAYAQDATQPAPAAAHAEDQEDAGLGEIVVTAQRQSEDLQKAALSVSAVSGDELIDSGISSVQQLSAMAPALQISAATGAYTWFALRGVSNTGANAFADPAVAVNLDSIYLATPTAMHGMLFDLERVEVLKGPQGTLYGRNATAGAINIISRRPTFELGGDATLEIANYGSVYAQGALNVPLSETIAVRVAGLGSKRDGYYSDGSGDDELVSGRASILFKPSNALSLLVIGDFTDQGGRGGGSTVRKRCGGVPCYIRGPWTGLADQPEQFAPLAPQSRNTYLDNQFRGVSGHLDWENAIGTLTVIAGHRWADVNYRSTTVGFLINEQQQSKQSSLEVRFASPTDQPLRWLAGAYVLDTDMRARSLSENAPGRSYGDQRTKTGGNAWALFGQLTWAATDTLRFVGGLRRTSEKKYSDSQRYNVANTIGPDPVIPANPTTAPIYAVNETNRWNATNWKLGVEWDVGARSLIYANASTGFKAGGFYSGPPGNDTYDPENLTAYVLGFKNRFLDNRLQVNGEIFYQDYRDQQISYSKIVGVASVSVTENAGRLTSKGFELDVDWLALPNTRLGGHVQYLDTEYKSLVYFTPSPPAAASRCALTPGQPGGTRVNCNGLPALQSPRWTLSGSIDQTIPLGDAGQLIAHANVMYETERWNHISYIPDTRSDANARVDASLTYETANGMWRLTAFGKNLTDTVTPTYMLPPPGYNNNGVIVAVLKSPRTYGLRLQARF